MSGQRAKKVVEKIEIEEVNESGHEKMLYLPHRPVIRKSAEATKVSIVYDDSAKSKENSVSLNVCLEPVHLQANIAYWGTFFFIVVIYTKST